MEHNIEGNLYASCISSHGGDSSTGLIAKIKEESVEKEVDRIINECIVLYMESARSHFGKPEAPFLPLTFSLWREVALKRLKSLIAQSDGRSVQIDQVMHQFSIKVDKEMLNDTYSRIIAKQYQDKLKEHSQYVPQELASYMDFLAMSSSYQKLMVCLSEWLTLMEMCDDLFERLEHYGIAHYIDKEISEKKIRSNWGIQNQNKKEISMKMARGSFVGFICAFTMKMSNWLRNIGVFGMVASQLGKWAIGIYFTHPSIFIGSLVSAVALQLGSEKFNEAHMTSEIDKITEYFSKVTSNLKNLYDYTTDMICEGFITGDTQKIYDSITKLLEGHGKDNEGSLQMFFDERDEEVRKLSVFEVDDDWMSIHKLKERQNSNNAKGDINNSDDTQ